MDLDPEYLAACGEFLDFAPVAAPGASSCAWPSDDMPPGYLDDLIAALGPVHAPPQPRDFDASRCTPSPAMSASSSVASSLRKSRDAPPCNNKLQLDARWPAEWIDMELKAFNAFVRAGGHGLDATDVAELKLARRRAKSRVYSGRHREAERLRRRAGALH